MYKSNPVYHSTPVFSEQLHKWPTEIPDLLQTKGETELGAIGELLSAKRACTNLEQKKRDCLHTQKKETFKNPQVIIPD